MGCGMQNLAGLFGSCLKDLLDFVYPPCCGLCGLEINRNQRVVCDACWRSLTAIGPPFCLVCGLPISAQGSLCAACETRQHAFSFARSYGLFDDVLQKIIHLFKYGKRWSLAGPLASLMAETMRADSRFSSMHNLMPVPLHPAKRRARGRNQSDLLATELSEMMGMPLLRGTLMRRVNTPPQSRLSLGKRLANVQDAFQVRHAHQVRQRGIVLVDDVLTTGSTTDACASVLLAAGAEEIAVITLARASEPGSTSRSKDK